MIDGLRLDRLRNNSDLVQQAGVIVSVARCGTALRIAAHEKREARVTSEEGEEVLSSEF
jgi:hypothetical protein